MNELDLTDYRIERLEAAINQVSGGDRTEFGRKLGYKDGAFIRQMLAGSRPVTEKTVAKIEALHGMSGWFTAGTTRQAKLPTHKQSVVAWAFPKIDENKIQELSSKDLITLEAAILIAAAQVGLDIKKN